MQSAVSKAHAPTELEALDLAGMDTSALRAELAASLNMTARHILRLSHIWAELEKRGEDLSELRNGIGAYLPAIAAGVVAAEAVVAFAGQPTMLRSVATLPIEEQRRLAAGGTVPLVVGSDKGYTHRMVPLSAIPARSIPQIFGNRCIREEAAQIALLSAPPPPWKGNGKPVRRGQIVIDRKLSIVRVGKAEVTLSEMVGALRAAGVTIT